MKITHSFLGVFLAIFPVCIQSSHGEEPARPTAPLLASQEEAEKWADKTLGLLTLEQKIGQMICPEMRGEYTAEDNAAYQNLLHLIREYGIGSLVLYGGSPYDTANLLNRLQRASKLPLMISSDFEGGPGQQFLGASEFPANMALSAARSEELAYAVGKVGAAEGRAIGIHLTYSPVVDIQINGKNPIMSVRSFGGDMKLLGRMVGAYIRGYQENGMLATAKHYPGHGDVEIIPGTEFTINRKPAEQIEAEEFYAFKQAIDAGVAYIMSEHIAIPSVTGGSTLPACVEKGLATDCLRGKLGFKNILTSDDMWYPKVVRRFGPVEACVLAVEAGHDVILKPADAAATARGLAEAVKSGRISQARIDASVRKILTWKARLNLHQNRFVDESRIAAVVGCQAHKALVQRVADESLTLVKNDGLFPLKAAPGKIVHLTLQKREIDSAPAAVDGKLRAGMANVQTFHLGPFTSSERFADAQKAAAQADLVVVSLFHARNPYRDNGPLNAKDQGFLDEVIGKNPKSTVVVSYGNPYLAECAKKAPAIAVGYGEGGFFGNQIVFADSFVKLLQGKLPTKGKLPVNVSANFPLGTGVELSK